MMMTDYLHGVDFAPTDGVHFLTSLQLLTLQNAKQYAVLLNSENWKKIDFKSYSRAGHPTLAHYDFSLTRVLKEASSSR